MLLHPPRSPLFPYTTLFRSLVGSLSVGGLDVVTVPDRCVCKGHPASGGVHTGAPSQSGKCLCRDLPFVAFRPSLRSEEHTSELQSRLHLVCRLLLEKKKYSS